MTTLKHNPRVLYYLLAFMISFFCSQAFANETAVFINEIHYDNDGADTGEGVEIAGPAGTDLTGWSVVYYNGANGQTYSPSTSLSGIIDDEGDGFGALSFDRAGIQNGSPDGLALIDDDGNVVQFLSYEGSFAATNGAANGMTSTDIGVSEPGDTPVGQSLQLGSTGKCYEDFTWNSPAAASFGSINPGQTFDIIFGLNCNNSDASTGTDYDDGWQTGDTDGSGFGPWTLVGGNDANSGLFIGNSTLNGSGTDPNNDGDINTTGDRAWGLYANNGFSATATRSFTAAMRTFSSLAISMDNGNVQSSGSVGFNLRNADGQTVLFFSFLGGFDFYSVIDASGLVFISAGPSFTDQGLDIRVTLLSSTSYYLSITDKATGTTTNISGDLLMPSNGSTPTAIQLFNNNAGTDSPSDVFFNSLEICHPPVTCTITDVTVGDQSPCNPDDNTYTQDVTVTWENGPTSGDLIVNDQAFTITGNPQTVTLTDLPANGNEVDINIAFSEDNCNFNIPAMFTAPEACFDAPNVVINEVDADDASLDDMEFVELYDGGVGSTDLSGLVLVLYNGGSSDASYAAFDLDGKMTNADGFFVIGNSNVPNVNLVFSDNTLQNGPDAVALYFADDSDFPNGTPVASNFLIDALVYDTNDIDDEELLNALTPGQDQINEGGNGDKDGHSNQRLPNGSGGALNTSTYTQIPPTPGAVNRPPVELPHGFVLLALGDIMVSAVNSTDGNMHANDDIKVYRGAPSVLYGTLTAVDEIEIRSKNTIEGDVTAGGELDNNGTINGVATANGVVDAEDIPAVGPFTAGTDDFTVEKREDETLAPGSYKDVEVERSGTLRLSTGEYFLEELEFGTDTRLIVDATAGKVIINIVDDLEFGQRMVISMAGGFSDQLIFNCEQSKTIESKREATILGTINAPNADFKANSYTNFRGALSAKNIRFATGATIVGHLSEMSFNKTIVKGDDEVAAVTIDRFELEQNYPNPFNPSTTIAFTVAEHRFVSLKIYNVQGQLIRILINDSYDAGRHTFSWDGLDDRRNRVASGIYIYHISAGDFQQSRKMIMMK